MPREIRRHSGCEIDLAGDRDAVVVHSLNWIARQVFLQNIISVLTTLPEEGYSTIVVCIGCSRVREISEHELSPLLLRHSVFSHQ